MKKFLALFKNFGLSTFLSDMINAIAVMADTYPFIKSNKLWNAFREYKVLSILTLILSALFTFYVLNDFLEHGMKLFGTFEPVTNTQGLINLEPDQLQEEIQEEGKKAFLSGGTKYLFLILMEVIIFAFCIKTLNILKSEKRDPKLKDFIQAEKRMIKVMIRNFVKGILVLVFLNVVCSMIGIKFIVPFLMFLVYSYYIGYAFLDNYIEQYGIEVKEGQALIQQHVGGTFALGLAANLFLFVPILGPFLVPVFGGVAASLYGDAYSVEKNRS